MAEPEDGRRGKFDDWEQVAEVSQAYEAELIAARLEESGIEVQVLDQSFEQIPLTNISDFELIRVLVPIGRADESKRILSKPLAIPEDAEVPEGEPEVPFVAAEDRPKE